MAKIKDIVAREIINSRGYPTIEGKIILDNGKESTASFASFDQLFDFQNKELKDNDEKRFNGAGVKTAVYYINNLIAPKLKGVDVSKQYDIDNWLIKADSTSNKSRLGVNTIMTISLLIAKAYAYDQNIPLYTYFNQYYKTITKSDLQIQFFPSPIFSLLKGGRHGQVNLDFQEFQIVPSSSFSYSNAYELGVDLYHNLRHLYKFQFNYNLDVLIAIKKSIENKNLKLGRDLFLSINFGANNYFSNNHYNLKDKEDMSYDEYYQFVYDQIINKFTPLIITDIFSNNDQANWKKLYQSLNNDTYIVVDELILSTKKQLEKYVQNKFFTTLVIRPNQIGTITEIILTIDYLKKNQLSFIISSEVGETNETYLADISVGLDAEFVAFGPPVHGENVAKYNRLLEIEKEINKQ